MEEHLLTKQTEKLVTRDPEAAPDLRDQVPDLEPYLLDEEKVIYVSKRIPRRLEKPPSGLEEFYALTGATNSNDVGSNGPALASKALENTEADAELRLYEAVFGRDSLRVAINMLDRYPRLAYSTLVRLAQLQGVEYNDQREEEPGKIVHEAREESDEIAQRLTEERGWGWPYYGAVDSTLEYIRTFSEYCWRIPHSRSFLDVSFTDRKGQELSMADSFKAAVDWMTYKLDANPDHLIEYAQVNPGGLENKVWKDSWDSYFHEDGTIANYDKGIASIEVQRVAFDALLDAAHIYEDYFGDTDTATELRSRAGGLKQKILDDFWVDEQGGYFILGTDRGENGELRKLKIRTSNMGHVLHSRLLEGDDPEIIHKREAVIQQLFSETMLNASGIRTLATDEARFRPGAYHNGSVWLWDTYLIAQGLEELGYMGLAEELELRLSNVIQETHQFPEFARGDMGDYPELNSRIVDVWDSKHQRVNRLEQPPQEVQAWSVAAILSIKLHNDVKNGGVEHITTDPKKAAFETRILDNIDSLREAEAA